MRFIVEPSALTSGVATVPGDKSVSHRALMLGAIAEGITTVEGFLRGEDCLATLAALRALGVDIDEVSATQISIQGVGLGGLKQPGAPLDLGNSGTAMRLMAGLLAGQAFSSRLSGDESLSQRPMGRVIDPLSRMGAQIDSDNGCPPLAIAPARQLSGMLYQLPVASAQVKSALLRAGLYSPGETTIVEPAITRDHTERMMRSMGIDVRSGESQIVLLADQAPSGTAIRVPADLSSAAFLILAALNADDCEITLENVGVNPTRTGVIDILREMGADISLENVRLYGEEPVADIAVKSSHLHGIEVPPDIVSLAIDEFPLLFVAAAGAIGTTTFAGIGELRVKESDRISTMAAGLKSLGVTVAASPDGAVGEGCEYAGGHVDSHGDHRIAMSFAVAALRATSPLSIGNAKNVDTSFPGFVDCLRSLGARITVAAEEGADA